MKINAFPMRYDIWIGRKKLGKRRVRTRVDRIKKHAPKAAFTLAATFVAACRQGLAMRSLAGVLTTGCLDGKLGFLPLHTNILEAKY